MQQRLILGTSLAAHAKRAFACERVRTRYYSPMVVRFLGTLAVREEENNGIKSCDAGYRLFLSEVVEPFVVRPKRRVCDAAWLVGGVKSCDRRCHKSYE